MSQVIEHDPKEPKVDRSNKVFYVAWAYVAFAWFSLIATDLSLDWFSFCLGGFTTAVFMATVTEKYGNGPIKF